MKKSMDTSDDRKRQDKFVKTPAGPAAGKKIRRFTPAGGRTEKGSKKKNTTDAPAYADYYGRYGL
jgi:hypothetical protein